MAVDNVTPVPAGEQAARMVNLLGCDRAGLESYLDELGERKFRAHQLIKWIHSRRILDFNAMTDLSQALRSRLEACTRLALPELTAEHQARDGVRKWLLQLADGIAVETVYIPGPQRGTLCVSAQAGCPLACSFCATGAGGFNRNLNTWEIVGQLWRVQQILAAEAGTALTNVVFMGMGEPLLNCDNVLPAVNLMLDPSAYNLSRRRVTVSTAGVIPGIARLARESRASLAVSLHATDDALRDQLVPINRSYPLARLLEACREFCALRGGDKPTFEYTLLGNVNDSPAQAQQLLVLLDDLPCKLNLIPFNPYPGARFRPSTAEVTEQFQAILIDGGASVTLRRTRGADIAAACGQLTGRVQPRAKRLQPAPTALP